MWGKTIHFVTHLTPIGNSNNNNNRLSGISFNNNAGTHITTITFQSPLSKSPFVIVLLTNRKRILLYKKTETSPFYGGIMKILKVAVLSLFLFSCKGANEPVISASGRWTGSGFNLGKGFTSEMNVSGTSGQMIIQLSGSLVKSNHTLQLEQLNEGVVLTTFNLVVDGGSIDRYFCTISSNGTLEGKGIFGDIVMSRD